MNIRNYVSNDHVMSVNEIATSQAQMIQLLTIEINEKDKEIDKLKKQLEEYENMRKEAIEYAKNSIDLLKPPCVSTINEEEYAPYIIIHDNYLNILNKVGGSDE